MSPRAQTPQAEPHPFSGTHSVPRTWSAPQSCFGFEVCRRHRTRHSHDSPRNPRRHWKPSPASSSDQPERRPGWPTIGRKTSG